METNLQNQVKNNSSQTFAEKQQNPKKSSSPSPISSSCSSPSHDFSFTISLSSSSSKLIKGPTKTTSSYQQTTDPFAVDLSPADEIFFHGHLLPLHLLSHLPVSPRTSTGSYNDGFALPVNDQTTSLPTTNNNNNENALSLNNITTEAKNNNNNIGTESEIPVKTKPIKSFSLFGLSKWRKGLEGNEREQQQQQEKKKLMSLDLSHAVKKYIRMLFQRRENGTQFRNRKTSSYSFSSSLMSSKGNNKTTMISSGNSYNKRDLIRARRGELFSAPASMRTSPTNSGHLRVSTAGLTSSSSVSTSSSSSESTMEELQAAIQAAIAHCKNSSAIDRDDKVKDS